MFRMHMHMMITTEMIMMMTEDWVDVSVVPPNKLVSQQKGVKMDVHM
jgi:hypothetical protein